MKWWKSVKGNEDWSNSFKLDQHTPRAEIKRQFSSQLILLDCLAQICLLQKTVWTPRDWQGFRFKQGFSHWGASLHTEIRGHWRLPHGDWLHPGLEPPADKHPQKAPPAATLTPVNSCQPILRRSWDSKTREPVCYKIWTKITSKQTPGWLRCTSSTHSFSRLLAVIKVSFRVYAVRFTQLPHRTLPRWS